jgi:hypothetical protein
MSLRACPCKPVSVNGGAEAGTESAGVIARVEKSIEQRERQARACEAMTAQWQEDAGRPHQAPLRDLDRPVEFECSRGSFMVEEDITNASIEPMYLSQGRLGGDAASGQVCAGQPVI